MPKRRNIRLALFLAELLVVIAVAISAALLRSWFEGAVLGIAGLALILNLRHWPPDRPVLSLRWFEQQEMDRLVLPGGVVLRPLDTERFIEKEREAALSTLPEKPFGSYPYGGGLSRAFTLSDERRSKFEAKVSAYADELRAWLEQRDQERRARANQLRIEVRLKNDGEAAATNIRLRVLFPSSFTLLNDDDEPEPPPERPELSSRFDVGLLGGIQFPPVPRVEAARGDLRGPRYLDEQGHLFVEYAAPHLGAGLRDTSASPIELQATEVGLHEVKWEAYADGLRKPARGTLTLEVQPIVPEGAPITQMGEPGFADDEE